MVQVIFVFSFLVKTDKGCIVCAPNDGGRGTGQDMPSIPSLPNRGRGRGCPPLCNTAHLPAKPAALQVQADWEI